MPRQIIKPDPDVDFYVEWSSVVEAPTAFGPRGWMGDENPDVSDLLLPFDDA